MDKNSFPLMDKSKEFVKELRAIRQSMMESMDTNPALKSHPRVGELMQEMLDTISGLCAGHTRLERLKQEVGAIRLIDTDEPEKGPPDAIA